MLCNEILMLSYEISMLSYEISMLFYEIPMLCYGKVYVVKCKWSASHLKKINLSLCNYCLNVLSVVKPSSRKCSSQVLWLIVIKVKKIKDT